MRPVYRRGVRLGIAAAMSATLGCYTPEAYDCSEDAMCVDSNRTGRCEMSVGYCSYESDDCESGRRYGPHAGEVARECTLPPFEAEASFALCMGEGQPLDGAGSCSAENGVQHLDVDVLDSDTDSRNAAFLQFPVGGDHQGAVTVRVMLTVAAVPEASSDATGTLWEVEPFTQESLQAAEPERLFPMLGNDQGAVSVGQTVEWEFELELASDAETVHLAVFPTGPDNVRYWSLLGTVPPRMRIE